MLLNYILSPIAGTIVDKVNIVKILYTTDFIRGVLFFETLYVLTLGHSRGMLIWILLSLTAISSVNQAFFGPAATSTISEIDEKVKFSQLDI